MFTSSLIIEIIETLQTNQLLFLVGSVFTIMGISLFVSISRITELRGIFLVLLTFVIYDLSHSLNEINSAFFLNLSTEIIGVMVVVFLLNEWTSKNTWVLVLVIIVISLSTVLIALPHAEFQQIMVNLSAELVGSFIIFVLIYNRDLIWNQTRSLYERRDAELRETERLLKQQIADKTLELNKEVQTQRRFLKQLKKWQIDTQEYNIAIKVIGQDRKDVSEKLRQLKFILGEIKVLGVENNEDDTTHCYVVATLANSDGQTAPLAKRN